MKNSLIHFQLLSVYTNKIDTNLHKRSHNRAQKKRENKTNTSTTDQTNLLGAGLPRHSSAYPALHSDQPTGHFL